MQLVKRLKAPANFDLLSVVELDGDIFFDLKRFFFVKGGPDLDKRAGHFHRLGNQIIHCIDGAVQFDFWDGKSTECIFLNKSTAPILVSYPIWRSYQFLEPNSLFVVFCDISYRMSETSYDKAQFLELVDV
jgi:hypothetical protein